MPRLFIVFMVFVFCRTVASAQSDSLVLNRNIKALENYAAANPIEKVHLHLDRQLYFPGDTIWFKAYVVLGEAHRLSALSGVLYVELISPKDSLEKRLTLKIETGTSHAEFALPYNAGPGAYRIRAYTNWMRNAGPEYFYDHAVTVAGFSTKPDSVAVKNTIAQNKTSSQTADKVDLQFFPEGGELVNGLRSKVAFKAINQNGMAEEVQGAIVDNTGVEVASFKSAHLGMGAFPLQPEKGKQYLAKVTAADGSTFTAPLPGAKDAGFALSVNNNLGDSLYVKVSAKNVIDTAFYLIAQSGGKYYFAAAGKLTNQVYTVTIAKMRFPTGIVQFTLFAQNGEPINERVAFIQNNDQLNLAVTADKQSYAPGEMVKMNLEAKNQKGEPVTGTFSVSVIDESKVPADETAENTIFSDLLLKSELAGYIEKPNYYFINPNYQTNADLDLLMLTQGYRRFEWKRILADKNSDAAYQPEKGFAISGTVKNQAGKPVPKGEVILTSPKNLLVMDTLTDENGRFKFNNIVLPDTATLVVNSKKANGGGNVKTTLDKPVYPLVSHDNGSGGYIANHFSILLLPDTRQLQSAYALWKQDSSGHRIMLKEVKIKDHKIPPFHPDYSQTLKYSTNLNGPGNANQVIMADESFPRYLSLAQAIENKIQGVVIRTDQTGRGAAFSERTIMRHLMGPLKPMAVYVDGNEVNPDQIGYINPADVHSVEVLTSAMYYAIYGSDAAGGALIITLKNGTEISNEKEPSPGLLTYKFNGFYKGRDFYSPEYSPRKAVTMADNRRTIYWNPGIMNGADGKALFDYLNAGSKGNYRVVIEGIDGEGRLGRQVYRYKVE